MKELTKDEMLETNGGGIWSSIGEIAGWKAAETAKDLGKAAASDLTRNSGEKFSDKNYREDMRNRREGRGGGSHERSGGRQAGDSGRDK